MDAAKLVRTVMTSDVPFLFHPSEIALYALRSAAAEGNISIASFMEATLPDPSVRADLDKVCEEMGRWKGRARGEDLKAEAQRIDAKLQGCRNPDRNPAHPQFLQREAKKLSEKQRTKDDRNHKVAEEQRRQQSELLGLEA
ncbi:hypothetical protein T484DRAFT_1773870 [Baffinella frigidus]|nr:hypothetical protein T484DRAFT_1773870 [Cryptophyta sp. CCMP2293]